MKTMPAEHAHIARTLVRVIGDEGVAELLELSRTKKIQAIKVVREHTGAGLREAKDFVEKHLFEASTYAASCNTYLNLLKAAEHLMIAGDSRGVPIGLEVLRDLRGDLHTCRVLHRALVDMLRGLAETKDEETRTLFVNALTVLEQFEPRLEPTPHSLDETEELAGWVVLAQEGKARATEGIARARRRP